MPPPISGGGIIIDWLLNADSAASGSKRAYGESAAAGAGWDKFSTVVRVSSWCSVIVVHSTHAHDATSSSSSRSISISISASSGFLFSGDRLHPDRSVIILRWLLSWCIWACGCACDFEHVWAFSYTLFLNCLVWCAVKRGVLDVSLSGCYFSCCDIDAVFDFVCTV